MRNRERTSDAADQEEAPPGPGEDSGPWICPGKVQSPQKMIPVADPGEKERLCSSTQLHQITLASHCSELAFKCRMLSGMEVKFSLSDTGGAFGRFHFNVVLTEVQPMR